MTCTCAVNGVMNEAFPECNVLMRIVHVTKFEKALEAELFRDVLLRKECLPSCLTYCAS